MARSAARILAGTLALVTLSLIGGCEIGPGWTPDGPQEVEQYAEEFEPIVYYP
jgi:hypothetical protein